MAQQLKVVIWKNCIIRKRHFILTLFEIITPILLFLLTAYARSKINGLNKVEKPEHLPTSEIIDNRFNIDLDLLYAPQTEFYSDLINRVKKKFDIHNNDVKGFNTEDDILKYYHTHHNKSVIAVIFQNNEDHKNLDYVIRYSNREQYSTNLYLNHLTFIPGVSTNFYSFNDFIKLQLNIDMSFMEKLSGQDLKLDFSIQEFPYPPYKENPIGTVFLICLPLISLFSFIFLCPAVLKRVVEEKHSGIKELMKMVGMKSWMLWLGWFLYGFIPVIFSVTCIVILMKVPFMGAESPTVEYANGVHLFIFLILYCSAAIAFCFALSCLFKSPTVAMVVGILVWILSYFVPTYSLGLEDNTGITPWNTSMMLLLLPNMALHFGFSSISLFEERELGVQWNNFYKTATGGYDEITMLNVYTMLIFDTVFYMLLTFYLDAINPGDYGVKKSIFFPFSCFAKSLRKRFGSIEHQHNAESMHLGNFEDGRSLSTGIKVSGLVKRYGHNVAVNNLNLDVYEQQITVLLGHNGAGKTTTMGIITGMVESTSGEIRMLGKDVKKDMDEIRKELGLCPQHNLLFPDLTVGEHLEFFAKLKGKNVQEARKEINILLKKLKMENKTNELAHTLSGGMKRKLCLGMAVIGGSKVLILDEPSSGMDPESRRELWDLLLSWRGEKTILITTHFMEEAESLGDWIAIMSHGSLQCYGTPIYLKKRFNTGYHLSLMIGSDCKNKDIKKVHSLVKEIYPETMHKDTNGNNIVFSLPLEYNIKLVSLLTELENKREELMIENISLTETTLEDVFLKTTIDPEVTVGPLGVDTKSETLCVDIEGYKKRATLGKFENLKLTFTALIKKRLYFLRKKKFTYIIPAFLCAAFFILTAYLNNKSEQTFSDMVPEIRLNLKTYKGTKVYYSGAPMSETIIANLTRNYEISVSQSTGTSSHESDVEAKILEEGKQNMLFYATQMVAGAKFRWQPEGLSATALFNELAIHSLPISVNLVTDALAKTYLGQEYSISVGNWPLPRVSDSANLPNEFSVNKVILLWSVMVPIGCLMVLGSFIIFPHVELSSNFTQLQYMCGVKPWIYWIANFIFDMIIYSIIILPNLMFLLLLPFCQGLQEFVTILVIFFMFAISGIPFAYLFTRKKTPSSAFALFVIFSMLSGIILSIVVYCLLKSQMEYYESIGKDLQRVFMVFIPQFGLTINGIWFLEKAVENYNMKVVSRSKYFSMCFSDKPNPCCSGEDTIACQEHKSYFNLTILKENFVLAVASFVIYMTMNVFFDSFIWKCIKSKMESLLYYIYGIIIKKKQENELEYDPVNTKNDGLTLRACNLKKSLAGKQIVKNIGFSLSSGKCLGILGVNGAGKTTTFKMLTREVVVDEGKVELVNKDNNTVDIGKDEYLQNLGYCPQSDALNFDLTGRQVLTVIAMLRAVEDVEMEVNEFLTKFELKNYADVPCGHYSGGNKRKLSLAVSLIGYPQYVLLDEPTNGVDPSSRRKFWSLIKNMQKEREVSFILTSHSMIECEALCDSLKIMKDGQFAKQGTISDLKKEFGGYSIKLKLNNKNRNPNLENHLLENHPVENDIYEIDGVDLVDGVDTNDKLRNAEDIKKHFNENFLAELKDEHSGMLHFYVKSGKSWSEIFGKLLKLKEDNPHLIEDYAISEASLEDVFLSVARS